MTFQVYLMTEIGTMGLSNLRFGTATHYLIRFHCEIAADQDMITLATRIRTTAKAVLTLRQHGEGSMDSFDPYHKWLGIPKKEQPANHYRLLGITVFEPDLDVIEAAADADAPIYP